MSAFDSKNGFIQYLFAEEDTYYLDSMTRLDLSDYLYYQLRRRHAGEYRYVYEISGLAPAFAVKSFDRESFNISAQKTQKGFLFKSALPEYNGMPLMMEPEQLRRLMREADHAAFIIRIQSFNNLFYSFPQNLTEAMQNSPQTGNRVFLLCRCVSSDSIPLFLKEDSIFRSKYAWRAFEDIEQCFRKGDASGKCYQDLKRLRKDGVQFLNDFSEENILTVVQWVGWDSGLNERTSPGQEKLVARFLWRWYHSPKMQGVYRDIMSPNENRSFEELAKDVRRWWPNLLRQAEAFAAEQDLYDDVEDLYVCSDDENVRRLSGVRFPESRLSEQADAYQRWSGCLREMRMPRCILPDEELRKLVAGSIGEMDDALRNNDLQTFERICAFLDYYNRADGTDNPENRELWETWRLVIEFSESVFSLDRQIEEELDTIHKWEEELNELLRISQQPGQSLSGTNISLTKQQVVSKHKQIEHHKKKYQYDIARKNQCQDAMQDLELALQTTTQYGYGNLHNKLESSLQLLQMQRDKIEAQDASLRESGQQLSDLLYSADAATMENEYESVREAYKDGKRFDNSAGAGTAHEAPAAAKPEAVPNLFDLLM